MYASYSKMEKDYAHTQEKVINKVRLNINNRQIWIKGIQVFFVLFFAKFL